MNGHRLPTLQGKEGPRNGRRPEQVAIAAITSSDAHKKPITGDDKISSPFAKVQG
jgi:hypothetical protein